MIKIPANDGNTYNVVGWSTFKKWGQRAILGFVILAIGGAGGVWGESHRASNQLKNKINTVVKESCLANLKPGSVYDKYNDLVSSIVEARTAVYEQDVLKNDQQAIKLDQEAISRYQKDFLVLPTKAQCEKPILK